MKAEDEFGQAFLMMDLDVDDMFVARNEGHVNGYTWEAKRRARKKRESM